MSLYIKLILLIHKISLKIRKMCCKNDTLGDFFRLNFNKINKTEL